MAPDLAVLEAEIARIPEVQAARVVVGDHGEPVEVHVLATVGKQAKQLVRDVQSVALAAAGIELDRRIVSVVQLEQPGGDRPTTGGEQLPLAVDLAAARLELDGITVTRRAGAVEVTVEISRGLLSFAARRVGDGAGTLTRLVAQATADAVADAAAAGAVEVEAARLVDLGEHQAVVVAVRLGSTSFAGAAIVRPAGADDAAARAVLDALNRRLGRGAG